MWINLTRFNHLLYRWLNWINSTNWVELVFVILKHNYAGIVLINTSIFFLTKTKDTRFWTVVPPMLIVCLSIPSMFLALIWTARTIKEWAYAVVYADECDITHSRTAFRGFKTEPLPLLCDLLWRLKVTVSVTWLLVTGLYYSETYNLDTIGIDPFFWIFGTNEVIWLTYLAAVRPYKSRYLNKMYIINQVLAVLFWLVLVYRAAGNYDYFYFYSLRVLWIPYAYVIVLINYVVDKLVEKRKQDRRMASLMNRPHHKGGSFFINEKSTETDYYFCNYIGRRKKVKIIYSISS